MENRDPFDKDEKFEQGKLVEWHKLERSENDQKAVLNKSIDALKTQLKHSRNPLEQRQIRQKIARLERELKIV